MTNMNNKILLCGCKLPKKKKKKKHSFIDDIVFSRNKLQYNK